jgi:hypothetical protein
VFTWARIGPVGGIWFEGKGGEMILTPLGRVICSVIFFVGAASGALCGAAFDARCRPGRGGIKTKTDFARERLWDRELDG